MQLKRDAASWPEARRSLWLAAARSPSSTRWRCVPRQAATVRAALAPPAAGLLPGLSGEDCGRFRRVHRVGTRRFPAFWEGVGADNVGVILDNVTFSEATTRVPEPGTLALAGLGPLAKQQRLLGSASRSSLAWQFCSLRALPPSARWQRPRPPLPWAPRPRRSPVERALTGLESAPGRTGCGRDGEFAVARDGGCSAGPLRKNMRHILPAGSNLLPLPVLPGRP
jgi:hypothetical protein